MSRSRLCADCTKDRLISNVAQMTARRGPNFLLWRRQMAASVGGVLLDDVLPKA